MYATELYAEIIIENLDLFFVLAITTSYSDELLIMN